MIATTRPQHAERTRNDALQTLDRRLKAIVARWPEAVDSTRARELVGSVLLKAECDLVDADVFEHPGRRL